MPHWCTNLLTINRATFFRFISETQDASPTFSGVCWPWCLAIKNQQYLQQWRERDGISGTWQQHQQMWWPLGRWGVEELFTGSLSEWEERRWNPTGPQSYSYQPAFVSRPEHNPSSPEKASVIVQIGLELLRVFMLSSITVKLGSRIDAKHNFL